MARSSGCASNGVRTGRCNPGLRNSGAAVIEHGSRAWPILGPQLRRETMREASPSQMAFDGISAVTHGSDSLLKPLARDAELVGPILDLIIFTQGDA